MEALLENLTKENLTLLIYFIIFFSILIVILIAIAVKQGREVSIWPPVIGKKVVTKTKHLQKTEESYSGFCADYENAHLADTDAINQTNKSFEFMGVSSQFLYTREGFLKLLSNRGIKFKFLLLDPSSDHAISLEKSEGIPVRRNILSSTLNLLDLKSSNNSIEVRFYNKKPVFRITLVNRDKCFISYYSSTRDNPQISFEDKNRTKSLFIPFSGIFDNEWESATKVTQDYLQKFMKN